MQGYIYLIENKINNKKYVGFTTFSIEKRFKEHCKSSKKENLKNRPLYCAFNKYGIENFSINVIEECDSLILPEKEKYWIKFYDTYLYGYNATIGGEGYPKFNHEEILDLYKEIKIQSKVAELIGCSTDTIKDVLTNYNVKIYENSHSLSVGKKVVAYDIITNEKIKEFTSQWKAGEWIQFLEKTKIKDLKKISYIIGRAAKHLDNRKQAYGFRWEFE